MKHLADEIDRINHEVELDENRNVKKCPKKSNYYLQNVNTETFGHQSFRYLGPRFLWIDSKSISRIYYVVTRKFYLTSLVVIRR